MGSKKKASLIQFNRELILAAAKKLFESNGIETTKVDDIAREADISKSTLYVYFNSKEDLLNYIIFEQMAGLRDLILGCIHQEQDTIRCYEAICRAMVTYQERSPVFFEAILKEIKVTDADMALEPILAEIYKVGEEINDSIQSLLEKGIEQGCIREDIEILPTIFYLWSSINQIIRFAIQKQDYLMKRLNMTKEAYMSYSFTTLLKSIVR